MNGRLFAQFLFMKMKFLYELSINNQTNMELEELKRKQKRTAFPFFTLYSDIPFMQ